MSARDGLVVVLVGAGVGITVLASLAMVRTREVFDRLHLTSPVSSLGGPLIAGGLIVQNGMALASAQIALIAVLLALTGPAVTMAVARVERQREQGSTGEDEPE